MKVLMISQGVPSPDYPMNGIHEMAFAQVLQQAGVSVAMAGIDLRSLRRKRPWGLQETTSSGILSYTTSWPGGRFPPKLLGRIAVAGLRKSIDAVRQHGFEPDLIHAYFIDRSYPMARLKEQYGKPLVVTEPSSAMNQRELKPALRSMGEFAYSRADALVVGCSQFRDTIRENFQREPYLVPMAVNGGVFTRPKKRPPAPFTFVGCGNLKPAKGQGDLIEAFSIAYPRGEERLLLIGEGEDRKRLEAMIKNYDLQGRVLLLGQLDQEKINEIYQQSHVFLHASHSETFGKVIPEALMAGLPVIAYDTGVARDAVDEESGLVIPLRDVKALARAMREIRKKKYDEEKLSRRAEENFSPKRVAELTLAIYEEVMGL